MSRNWTPREMLLHESLLEGKTWRDVSKGLSISYKGKTTPMINDDDNKILDSYNYLGRLYPDNLCSVYRNLKELNSLGILDDIEKELSDYIEDGVEIPNSPVIRWFDGKLVSNFYYSEENDMLLEEEIISRVKS